MIVLDTNVLSALMAAKRNPGILAWADRFRVEDFWTTTITIFVLRHGIERVKDPVRRADLDAMYKRVILAMTGDRLLSIDEGAANAAAVLKARREKDGVVQEIRDTLIAGISVAHGATLATRNVRHFANAGVPLVDPWDEAADT
ncbi:PIN domain-containing protein [Niveispirillum sp.]|uniref:PIN domain-containing protein n=1 Tax=Niveispirillum sp. TaxID=1917217 RepID=UPI001B54C65A|nr:PIN domain-containing protein [Niveispirillum sp.]MBP7338714.1 PIN domain-containing protein [Niveispirillum sp.]